MKEAKGKVCYVSWPFRDRWGNRRRKPRASRRLPAVKSHARKLPTPRLSAGKLTGTKSRQRPQPAFLGWAEVSRPASKCQSICLPPVPRTSPPRPSPQTCLHLPSLSRSVPTSAAGSVSTPRPQPRPRLPPPPGPVLHSRPRPRAPMCASATTGPGQACPGGLSGRVVRPHHPARPSRSAAARLSPVRPPPLPWPRRRCSTKKGFARSVTHSALATSTSSGASHIVGLFVSGPAGQAEAPPRSSRWSRAGGRSGRWAERAAPPGGRPDCRTPGPGPRLSREAPPTPAPARGAPGWLRPRRPRPHACWWCPPPSLSRPLEERSQPPATGSTCNGQVLRPEELVVERRRGPAPASPPPPFCENLARVLGRNVKK